MQNQIRGFIIGAAASVPEKQTFGIKAGNCMAQSVAQGLVGLGHYGAPRKRVKAVQTARIPELLYCDGNSGVLSL
jgi:hypothetical protein